MEGMEMDMDEEGRKKGRKKEWFFQQNDGRLTQPIWDN